jgi:hypothetical protein
MALVSSNWKITWDPAGTPETILSVGDDLAGDIIWRALRSHEVVDLLDATTPFLRDGRTLSLSATFVRIVKAADDAAARAAVLDALVATGTRGKLPVRIEPAGTTARYWQAPAALIISSAPMPRLYGVGEWQQEIEIIMTGLVSVTPPPP